MRDLFEAEFGVQLQARRVGRVDAGHHGMKAAGARDLDESGEDRGRSNHERACESTGTAARLCHAELAAAAAPAARRDRRPLLPARTLRSGPALRRAVRWLCRGRGRADLALPGLWPVREPRA